jgi:hypothetical protein
MPGGWGDWVVWQTSSKGKVPGIGGNVDLDTFNGSVDDLYAYVGYAGVNPGANDGVAPIEGGAPEAAGCEAEGCAMGAGIRRAAGNNR